MTKNHAEAAWLEGEEGLSIQALRRFLRDRLPEHMVPSFFVLLDDLPLTPNGKIDRRALELVGTEGFFKGDGDAPATPVEEILAGLWSEVLGIPRPARHDSFFDLGGHSLLATQVHSRMRAAFGVEIPLRLLFEEPTLAALGAAVERALAAGDAGAAGTSGGAPPIEPRPPGDDSELPLSFAQQRLWFLAQLDPASPAYNVPIALRFSGQLDRGALAACLTEVAARHEALRTTFVPSADDPGRPVQRIAPPAPVPLPLVDLAGLPAPEPEARRLALEEEMRPFDLARGPLLRSTLLRLGEDDHAVLFNLHHIISDGWSTGVLVSEVAALYGAYLEGRPSPLPPLPVQYADFARWQRSWLQGEALRAQIAFWRERLAGAPPALEIPGDRPRPAAPTGQGGVRRPHLSRVLVDGLNAYARRHGVTLFMVLLAGWKSLLHRLTGETDLLIGSPIANRTRPEIEGLIGFFVNTLVLRTDLAGGPSFREAVVRERETALAAYAHQDLPFERLVEVLVPERSLARTPFFQVMVALQNAPQGDLTLPGLKLAALPVEGKTAKFDITLELYEAPDGLRGRCEYSSDLFDGPTLDRLLGQWGVLLEGALADPQQPLAALPLLPEAERHQALVEWNAPAWSAFRDGAPEEPVHRRFLAEAAQAPERVAVMAAEETVTYGEVAERALHLAGRLRELGVGPDVPVGVFLSRGAGLVTAMIGVLEAGGAYLPLDPAYPRERLAFMLEDAGNPLIVTEAALAEDLPLHQGQFLYLDGEPERPSPRGGGGWDRGEDRRGAGPISGDGVFAEAAAPLLSSPLLQPSPSQGGGTLRPAGVDSARGAAPVQADNLSYLVYTSGSTGRPKGIALPHRVLSNLIGWQLGDWALPPGTGVRTLMFASPSFDASLHESLATLLAGGTLVVATEEHRRDPESLLRWMIEARVERFFLPFVAFQQIAEVAARDGLAGQLAWKEVQTAGEQLVVTPEIRAVFAGLPGAVLYNHYGPSETHVVTTHTLGGSSDAWPALPPIGRPIAGTAVYVADREMQPAPVGVPGQVFLGGVMLARGYLGRPDLTAERFLPDPWSPAPGARMYQAGDLARLRPDGALDFLGRTDHQVKIRGYRVEPGEIEAALNEHPAVREAAVVVLGQGVHKRLAACVIPAGDPLLDDLRAHLRERLPDYMVPAVFRTFESFPLTDSGKVSRRLLAEHLEASASPDAPLPAAAAPPRTPVEELLASIWSEVLQSGPVGIHDSFFELGGHSLLGTQVFSRLRRTLGVEVPLKALFETPTVAGLARTVEKALQTGGGVVAPPVERRPPAERSEAPLSFAQQRLWFLTQLQPDSSAYNLPAALRLRGRLDRGALAASLEALSTRHEALRTTFEARGPKQVIAPPGPVPLPLVDLAALPDPESEARRLADEEVGRRFDLARGPLLRSTLLRLGPEEHVALFTMHHIVSDGWSMGVLVREVAAFYAAALENRPAALPPLIIQYADFARWQRDWLRGEVLETQLAYWRERLAGAPSSLNLPTDRPRSARTTGRGGLLPVRVPAATADGLTALARQEGATLFMVLLAGWKALLHRYTGETDLLVGTAIANRNRAEIEGLIGFFVNTLVLRTDLAGAPDLAAFVGRVRETTLGAYVHQDLPFERLVEELAPDRSLAHTPFFQVMLVLQNTPLGTLDLPGVTMEPFAARATSAAFELNLSAMELGPGNGIGGTLEFDRDLFEPATAERLAGHFVTLLGSIATEPRRPVADLPLLPEAERRQILDDWNGEAEDHFPPACLHELFAEQAGRTPDALALDGPGGRATYAELAEKVRRLAGFLRGIGVGPEVPVGVCAGSSAEMVTAMLATWTAGGAYLPIDPAYPAERKAFLLEDSGARAVLFERGVELPAVGIPAYEMGTAPSPTLPRFAGEGAPAPADLDATGGADFAVFGRAEGALSRASARGRVGEGAAVPANTAWIVYTSGSTGRPKGAMIEHQAAADYLRTVARVWELGPGERVLQFSSPSFDVVFEEVLPALFTGATVVLRGGPQRDLWEPAELLERANELGLTAVELPSAYWHQWVQSFAARPDKTLPAGNTLRLLCAGGETMPPETARLWFRTALREIRLINSYGPTEVVVGCTLPFVHPEDAQSGAPIPIGRLLPGRTGYVVDRAGNLLPAGVPGELLLGGILARGFVGRPDLTAERFVPDAHSGLPGERLYRSGDLVRWLPDGRLDILGRIDFQVKLRGFRIEPAEVEAVLGAVPGVREAAVLVRDDLPGGKGLAAYTVADDPALTEAALRDALAGRLPGYMVPAAFVLLPAFPLTANGKIDRKALPAPANLPAPAPVAELRDPVEQVVAAVWSDLLGIQEIGPESDFFSLGGHSLLATQVLSRLRAAFGIDFPLRLLFEAPTLGELAAALRTEQASGEALPAPPPLVPAPREGVLPLSFAQQRLWFLDQLDPGDPSYDIPAALHLAGPLDVPALEAALRGVVERHEVLRTTFGPPSAATAGEPFQRIAADPGLRLPRVDLGGLSEETRAAELRRLGEAETSWRFDLDRGPLLRTVLIRLGPEEHAVLFTLHHIVSDGWSTGILVREVTALYAACREGRPSPLPPLGIQYADFAAWQRGWLQGDVLERHLGYWRRRLGGDLPPLDLPFKADRPARLSSRGAGLPFALDPNATAALRALARREGASLFMVLTAALQAFLRRYSRSDRVVVGTDIAGRNHLETEGLIGFFVNVLPLATELSGDPTFRELVGRVRETTLGAFTHQDLPFDRLVQELQPERGGGETPLFQVLFVLQNAPEEALDLPGLRIAGLPLGVRNTKFDLLLMAEETGDGVAGSWVYRTDLFDGAAAGRLAESFSGLLAAVAAEPDVHLSRLEREGEPAPMESPQKTVLKPDLKGRRAAARQSLDPERRELVRQGDLAPGQLLPGLIEPAAPDVDLVTWAAAHRDDLEAELLRRGALLFRGFGVGSAETFERFARVFVPELYGEYGDLPREAVGGETGKIYSSTPYPPDQPILFHNESSQMHLWPLKQLFFCLEAAREGGETPIADSREVYRRLDPALRRRFRDLGLVYVRNFTAGLDVDWKEFFRTDDRARVEAYCRDAGIECEWRGDDLTTRKQAPAVAIHPKTGEAVFFNQIQAHHISCLPAEVRDSLLSIFGESNLPRNVYFGDGTPITAEEMDAVRAVYREVAVEFPWQPGDVLLVDNMLTAHGRNAYAGPRRILVAMGEMFPAAGVRLPD